MWLERGSKHGGALQVEQSIPYAPGSLLPAEHKEGSPGRLFPP